MCHRGSSKILTWLLFPLTIPPSSNCFLSNSGVLTHSLDLLHGLSLLLTNCFDHLAVFLDNSETQSIYSHLFLFIALEPYLADRFAMSKRQLCSLTTWIFRHVLRGYPFVFDDPLLISTAVTHYVYGSQTYVTGHCFC